MSGTDDLLEQARNRLRELEEHGDDDQLGDRVALDPGEYFQGRWRADALVMNTRDGDTVEVYGLWDATGHPRFVYKSFSLVQEVDAARPQVGDEVAIVRGQDREFEKDGETRRMHRYAIQVRPCSDPLPGKQPADSGGDGEVDIPF